MTDDGRMKRFGRLNRAGARRARMRGQREAHKRGLDVRRVRVNACSAFGWEAWYGNNPHENLREFHAWGIDGPIGNICGAAS